MSCHTQYAPDKNHGGITETELKAILSTSVLTFLHGAVAYYCIANKDSRNGRNVRSPSIYMYKDENNRSSYAQTTRIQLPSAKRVGCLVYYLP